MDDLFFYHMNFKLEMPSSRDLSSPTDVHSQDDASDRGAPIVIDNNMCCFIFCDTQCGNN